MSFLITSCSSNHYINTRAKFTAKGLSQETIEWVSTVELPKYVKHDMKVCIFNARVINRLNDNNTKTEVVLDSTWAKLIAMFGLAGNWIFDKLSWGLSLLL